MFSIKESLKYGWQKSKEHLELVLFSTLLILATGSLTELGQNSGFGHKGGLSFFGFIVMIFLIIIRIGYTKIFLKIHDGQVPKFVEIFQEYKTFWRYLGVSILVPLAVLGGLILLIIPGLIWAVRFSFAPIIVIDDKIGPIASMKESYAITKGSFWKILGFWFVIILVNILGFVFFGIGLLVSVPVSMFASVMCSPLPK
jgi:uncharacterized membrane protein